MHRKRYVNPACYVLAKHSAKMSLTGVLQYTGEALLQYRAATRVEVRCRFSPADSHSTPVLALVSEAIEAIHVSALIRAAQQEEVPRVLHL